PTSCGSATAPTAGRTLAIRSPRCRSCRERHGSRPITGLAPCSAGGGSDSRLLRPLALHLRADQSGDFEGPLFDEPRNLARHSQVLLPLLEDARVPVVLLLLGRELRLGRQ